jgi:ribonuclease Z
MIVAERANSQTGRMEIHCLGTTGYHPCATRQTSCYVLPADGVVLDAGTGLFRLAPLIQTDRLDILLSHAHLDHIVGLTFLLDVLYQRPVPTIAVWGEQAKLAAVRTHLFDELIFPAEIPVQWNAIDALATFPIGTAGEITVDWRPQQHPGGSVAYRLRWPDPSKTLIYATDTVGDTSDACRDWMHGADLLMHECYFRDSQQHWATKTGHCWTSRVAEIARRAEVKQLLLTHINPLASEDDPVDLATATALFANTHVANDGDIIRF